MAFQFDFQLEPLSRGASEGLLVVGGALGGKMMFQFMGGRLPNRGMGGSWTKQFAHLSHFVEKQHVETNGGRHHSWI